MGETPSAPQVTKEDILRGLRALGVAPGFRVMVHSSLKSFGYVVGGAAAVIDALKEAVTEAGTIMMPSFNHGRIVAEGQPGYFDPTQTPTTNGAIPDLFWRLPGARRSWNPTHAFAAWGRDAERCTRLHHRTLTAGPDSPLGMLWRDGGHGLMLGVGYGPNTFHHVVEMTLRVPCLGPRGEAYPMRLPDGRMVEGRTWIWRERPCPFTDRKMYVSDMQARGLEKRGRIGNSEVILFRLQDCFEVVAEILRHGRDGLPPCSGCPIRPRRSRWGVPSDWDAEAGRLRPDSPALGY